MAIFELVEEITTAMDNSMSTVAVSIDLKRRLIQFFFFFFSAGQRFPPHRRPSGGV